MQTGSCVSDIAGRTNLAQSLVSTTVAKLKDRGIFSTAPDPADRRRTMVSVLPAARKAFGERGARPITGALARVLPQATPDELLTIEVALTKLAGQLLPAAVLQPSARTRSGTAGKKRP